jgi:hypothetical protein
VLFTLVLAVAQSVRPAAPTRVAQLVAQLLPAATAAVAATFVIDWNGGHANVLSGWRAAVAEAASKQGMKRREFYGKCRNKPHLFW